jgi:phenylpyruvate tautomerase PptA (4-oxalocrotonate tautomerase family)
VPILEVELVGPLRETAREGLAARIADRAAEVFGAEPGTVWVALREIPREDYAESGGGPPAGTSPVIVRVLKSRIEKDRDDLAAEAAALTRAVAGACGRPAENVHLVYEPPGAGRVAFGGGLVPGDPD